MKTRKDIDRTAIIGARGQMGGLFSARCRAAGIAVAALDRPLTDEAMAASLGAADLVLVSVPAAAMDEVLSRLAPHLRPPTILVDVTSVKVEPMRAMRRFYDGPIVGTHPLFGPEPAPDAQRVAVVPSGSAEDEAQCRAVETFLVRLGFTPFRAAAEAHDQAMALIQGLNFVTTVSYLAILSQDQDLRDFITPSFERRLDAAKKMLTEDAELFAGLFEANPFSQDAVRRFRKYLDVAAGGDVDILVERAKWWWGASKRHNT